jgi:hypothetical protein
MKWFAKFKISAALDSHKPLPRAVRNASADCDELHRFEKQVTSVERALKETPPPVAEPPPGLHRSIMRAVQAGAPESTPAREPVFGGWLPASALAALVLFTAWWAFRQGSVSSKHHASERDGLAPAAAALELGQQATQRMPAEMVAPLSEEWQRLNLDLDRAQEFLLASVP